MTTLLSCGHRSIIIARDRQSRTFCVDCSYALELAALETETTYYGYLDLANRQIVTWNSDRLIKIHTVYMISHNLWYCRHLTYWRGTDHNGNEWYGRCSGDGMSTTMHRCKSRNIATLTTASTVTK